MTDFTATSAIAPPDFIKLVSSDGFEFFVSRKVALESPFVKDILSSPGTFIENKENEINFREISAAILEKVIQYMHYKNRYSNASEDIPQFTIEPEIAVELLMASNFLSL